MHACELLYLRLPHVPSIVLPPSGMEQAITSPVRSDYYENRVGDQVLEIFQNTATKYRDLCSVAQAPPVLTKERKVYLFDLGPEDSSWE